MKFNIHSTINLSAQPPQMVLAMKLIRALKDGELISTVVLSERLNTSQNCISRYNASFPPDITMLHKGKRLYGNPKTIAAFKKAYAIQT